MAIQNHSTDRSNYALISEISSVATARYGNFAEPKFHFVEPGLAKLKSSPLLLRLNCLGAEVVDDTDLNCDVSISLLIKKGEEELALQLSFVGPYAALRRIPSGQPIEAIASRSDCRTEMEREIVAVVSEEARLLDRNTLLSPFAINLTNTDLENSSVYNLLFADCSSGL